MKKQTTKYTLYLALILILTLSFSRRCMAQLKGDHLVGDFGLNAGTQAPPGVSLFVPLYWYSASSLKNSQGEIINRAPDVNVFFGGIGGSVVTNLKLLGGNYAFTILAAGITDRVEGNLIQEKKDFAFTDMFVQPIQLGWHRKRADFVAGYSMYIPTGKYEFGNRDNSGLGMWGHEFSLGATVLLDSARKWNISSVVFFELHGKKKNTDIKVGSLITAEGGIGRTFYKPVCNTPIPMMFGLGAIYYTQFKVTEDEIPLFNRIFTGNKDHIYAIGAEGNWYYPRTRTMISFRWFHELGAVNRFEGNTYLLTLGWQVKSLMKKERAKKQ